MTTAQATRIETVSLAKLAAYGTTVDDCGCANHHFASFHSATHVCKHMQAARTIAAAEASRAAAYRCRNCGVDAAAPGRAFCAGCAHVLSQFAAEANAPTWTPVAHCTICGAAYDYSDDAPFHCPSCQRQEVAA